MPQTYSFPIPAGKTADELLAKAKEAGRAKRIALVGDGTSGTFKGAAEGTYAVANGAIAVTVDKKPGIVPWMMIETALRELFS